jgi:hypothetical protein
VNHIIVLEALVDYEFWNLVFLLIQVSLEQYYFMFAQNFH